MATATVTLKVTPVELKVVCDALAMYASCARALAQNEETTAPTVEGDPRRAHALARDIRRKIGFES